MRQVNVAEYRKDPQATCRLAAETGEPIEIIDENGVALWRVAVPPADLRRPFKDEKGHWCAYISDFKKYRWLVDGIEPIKLLNDEDKAVMLICDPMTPDLDDCDLPLDPK